MSLKANVRCWRIFAIKVVAAFFRMANRAWSMCGENTAYRKRPWSGGAPTWSGPVFGRVKAVATCHQVVMAPSFQLALSAVT
jgi:hypothetical protein